MSNEKIIIFGKRRSGRTKKIIELASENDGVVITASFQLQKYTMKLAKSMNKRILCFSIFEKYRILGLNKKIYIDDFDLINKSDIDFEYHGFVVEADYYIELNEKINKEGNKMTDAKDLQNRFSYHFPSSEKNEKYNLIRENAYKLALLINDICPKTIETETALKKLEEVMFWSNAGIARS